MLSIPDATGGLLPYVQMHVYAEQNLEEAVLFKKSSLPWPGHTALARSSALMAPSN